MISPGTLAAVRTELGRIRTNPTDTLLMLAFNSAMVLVLWFALPRTWFFTFTGPEGLPYALAGWMYADVCATNVLAPDRERVLSSLDDPRAFAELLRSKALGLWLLVGPACATLAIIISLVWNRSWQFTTEVVLAVAVVPLGALAMTSLVGIMFPYHLRSLRWRWEHRRQFKQVILRWLVLLVLPYTLYPVAFGLIVALPVTIWRLSRRLGWDRDLSTIDFLVCVTMAVIITALMWTLAHRFAVGWVRRHRERVREYLLDVERG
ncbi:putative membrane protein [Gordonia polyisoprenivorans VH2]|uniref:Transmembrane protein n=2 Tax=Gordonia polyisoprenivorans TaxID=84595 RepID=A0A846WMV9_9ACTN|nr:MULTISPECIES: hypothetical protein [Gordonia]AFA74698.1 putative membrane protein [Gordonia polyisoprenivorans VH2]MBE7192832.1 hypothetical protein [Gordonia polyisoprenivorans]MDF3283453.1 hypothetical protein [Gordonia sp. N1V]NKY02130.1 hypothetical protein [Gordonia polyisoprenivorans]OPX13845.1 hypothetical protein B1964_18020 [Gordonia sp. i37]